MKTKLNKRTCGLALLGAVPSAQGNLVLDNTSTQWTNGASFPGGYDLGLVFKTGSTGGNIDALAFAFLSGGDAAPYPTFTFSAYLYQWSGAANAPVGAALATKNGLSATFTGAASWTQQLFSYNAASLGGLTSVELAANTNYALVLGNSNVVDQDFWATASPSSYTLNDGYSFVRFSNSTDNGATWGPLSGWAPIASISVNMSAIPEPTSMLSTIALVSSGLLLRRRTKTLR